MILHTPGRKNSRLHVIFPATLGFLFFIASAVEAKDLVRQPALNTYRHLLRTPITTPPVLRNQKGRSTFTQPQTHVALSGKKTAHPTVSTLLPKTVAQQANAPKIDETFESFFKTLSPQCLSSGQCVDNAAKFAEYLSSKVQAGGTNAPKVDPNKIRIVLVVKEPATGYMPRPLQVNWDNIRGLSTSSTPQWIWHAFTMVDGVVYDANFKNGHAPIKEYVQSVFNVDADSNWVFSVKPSDLPKIQGSPYPGARPKMFNFKPMTFSQLIQTPEAETIPKETPPSYSWLQPSN